MILVDWLLDNKIMISTLSMTTLSFIYISLVGIPKFIEKLNIDGNESTLIKYYSFIYIQLHRNLFAEKTHKNSNKKTYQYQCFLSNSQGDFNKSYEIPHVSRSFDIANIAENQIVPFIVKSQDDDKKIFLNFLLDHVDRSKQLAIVKAPAGFGKTNLCLYIANLLSSEKYKRKVFMVAAKEIIDSMKAYGLIEGVGLQSINTAERCIFKRFKYRLGMVINKTLLQKGVSLSLAYISEALHNNAILLIDSFDEIGNIDEQSKLLSFLTSAKNIHDKNLHIFLFGRDVAFSNMTNICNSVIYNIEPLTINQTKSLTKKIIKTNFLNNEKFDFDNFYSRISTGTIKDMATNPLLLSMMISLYMNGKKTLPENKSKLVEDVIKIMINRRFGLFPQKEKKISVTEYIKALPLITNHKNYNGNLESVETKEKLDEWTRENNISLDEIDKALTISGITLKSNHNTFTFSHKTFQEYMQSELLLGAYKKDNIKSTIAILNQNLSSEIPYYFFYKTRDTNEIFETLLNDLAGNDFRNNWLCAFVYVMNDVVVKGELTEENKAKYESLLQAINQIDSKLYAQTKLRIILEKLKHSWPIMECHIDDDIIHSITNDEVKSPLNSNIETYNKINIFLIEINKRHSDNRGIFTPITKNDALQQKNIKHDEIIYSNGGYTYFDMKNKFFGDILIKYEIYINEIYMDYKRMGIPSNNYGLKFIAFGFSCILNNWKPDILINRNQFNHLTTTLSGFLTSKKPPEFTDPTIKARISREGHLSSLRNILNTKRELGEFDLRTSIITLDSTPEKLSFDEKQKILDRLIIQLTYDLYQTMDDSAANTLLRIMHLTTLMALEAKKVNSWGKIRLCFSKKT